MEKEIEYAWAAGFFDADGCVNLHVNQNRYVTVTAIIVQKAPIPLEKFQSIFGADEKIGVTYRKDRRLPYYRLQYSGQRAAYVLSLMFPYLVLKRDVAKIALDLQASVNSYSPRERKAGLPDAEMEYRQSLVSKAKWLNSGRWAAATTKSSGPERVCDSLDCTDGKGAEMAEMTIRQVQ